MYINSKGIAITEYVKQIKQIAQQKLIAVNILNVLLHFVDNLILAHAEHFVFVGF